MADLKITKVLTDNKYSVTPEIININTTDNQFIEDFGEPQVMLGGTIDVISTTTPLAIDQLATTGVFVDGENITGGTSGATAKIWKVTNTILYVTDITGTFSNGEILTGQTSGATTNLVSVNSDITQFEVIYGSAPNSTTNFTVNIVVRKLPSGFPVTFTFDGDVLSEAENNAKDLVIQIRYLVNKAWTDLKNKINNFEDIIIDPLP